MSKSKSKRKSKHPVKGAPTRTPRLLLSLDPALAAGMALFIDGKLVAHAPADGSSFRSFLQVVAPHIKQYAEGIANDDRVVVMEQHWIPKFGVNGSLTLGQRRGIAQSVGEAVGCTRWFYVPSSTWQSWAFGGKRVEDTKAASIERVTYKLHTSPATDDVADAINMGDYFLQQCCIHASNVP